MKRHDRARRTGVYRALGTRDWYYVVVEINQYHMISCLRVNGISPFIRRVQTLGGKHVVSVGTASSTPLSIHLPSLCSVDLLLFENFVGGTENQTLNRVRTHANPRIISPGHYHSCYPAVESWRARWESNPVAKDCKPRG